MRKGTLNVTNDIFFKIENHLIGIIIKNTQKILELYQSFLRSYATFFVSHKQLTFFLLKSRLQSHFLAVNCGVFWW